MKYLLTDPYRSLIWDGIFEEEKNISLKLFQDSRYGKETKSLKILFFSCISHSSIHTYACPCPYSDSFAYYRSSQILDCHIHCSTLCWFFCNGFEVIWFLVFQVKMFSTSLLWHVLASTCFPYLWIIMIAIVVN